MAERNRTGERDRIPDVAATDEAANAEPSSPAVELDEAAFGAGAADGVDADAGTDVAPGVGDERLRTDPLTERVDPTSLGGVGGAGSSGIDAGLGDPGDVLDGRDDRMGDLASGHDLAGRAGMGDPSQGIDKGYGASDPESALDAGRGTAGKVTLGGGQSPADGNAPTPYPTMKTGGGGDAAPRTSESAGDEAGTLKGVASPFNMDKVKTKMSGSEVKVEGKAHETTMKLTDHDGEAGEATGTEVAPSQTKVIITADASDDGGGGTEGTDGTEPPPADGGSVVTDQVEGGGSGTGYGTGTAGSPIDPNDYQDAPHTGWGDGHTDPTPDDVGAQYDGPPPAADETIFYDLDPDAVVRGQLPDTVPEPDQGDIDWGDGT